MQRYQPLGLTNPCLLIINGLWCVRDALLINTSIAKEGKCLLKDGHAIKNTPQRRFL